METEIMVTCEKCGQDRPETSYCGASPKTCSRCRFPRLWAIFDKPIDPATRAFARSFARMSVRVGRGRRPSASHR